MKNREQGKSESSKIGKVRLFFAIWPDEGLCDALHELARQQQAACGGRVMRAETLHLTLLFLGDIPADRLFVVQQAGSAVHMKAFTLEFGRFAGWRHNAIGYAAPVGVPEALPALVAQLRERAAEAGVSFDRKAYKPHVTLLRDMARIPPMWSMNPLVWRVKEFVLVQSVLDQRGARYEIVGRWPLE